MTTHADTSVFNKRSFLLNVYRISLVIVVVYLISFWFNSVHPLRQGIMITCFVLFCIGYWITVKNGSIVFAAHFYSTVCYGCVSFIASTRGGVAAPGMIWLMMCPMVCFLTVSFTAARIWLGIVLTTMVTFYFFDSWIVLDEFSANKLWNLLAYTLFLIALYFMLRSFRKKVVSRAVELLRVNALLEESRHELSLQHAQVEKARAIEAERSQKLRNYLNQHLEIARMEEIHTGSFHYAIQVLQRFLIKSFSAESTAIWYRHPETGELKLIGSQGKNSQDKFELNTVQKHNFPDTMEMLESGAIVVWPGEFSASQQLAALMKHHPGDAMSVIGCPFFIEGKFGGFFICKASGRVWAEEDIIFIRAISDTLALTFKSHQRRLHQRLLEIKTKEIQVINESLESKVTARTMELNDLNSRLTDIAFTNAHVIRGPICRLVGLKNLLSLLNDEKERLQVIEYMQNSIDELDAITRRTSDQLNSLLSPREQHNMSS